MAIKQQKRVAHFVRKLLPPFTTFIRDQILNHSRYNPYVVYKEYIDSDFSKEIINSLNTYYCERDKKGITRTYSQFIYNHLRRLTKEDKKSILPYLHESKINILHFHYGTDAGMYLEIAKHAKIPSVVSFYGYDCSSFPQWYFGYGKHYLQKVFAYTNYCLAMSEDMKSDLLNLGCPENKIIVHYYGVDVKNFFFDRKYKSEDSITFLIVGSLVPQKGHLFLLQAFNKALSHTEKKLNLRIVGNGYLISDLREFVRANNITENVCFVGALKHLSKEFLKEYYHADVFIHPSVTSQAKEKEGIPGTIVEAMASGLPVISTYHAGIPYIVKHEENGFLTKEWDIDTLADYICKLTEDSELRMKLGKKAQEYAMERLDLKQKEIELENIYDVAIENYRKI